MGQSWSVSTRCMLNGRPKFLCRLLSTSFWSPRALPHQNDYPYRQHQKKRGEAFQNHSSVNSSLQHPCIGATYIAGGATSSHSVTSQHFARRLPLINFTQRSRGCDHDPPSILRRSHQRTENSQSQLDLANVEAKISNSKPTADCQASWDWTSVKWKCDVERG